MNRWREVTATVPIRAARPAAWERLREFGGADAYVPGLVSCEVLSAAAEGVGARRRVRHRLGMALDETVVEWEPQRGFALSLERAGGGAPKPFCAASFRYRLDNAPGAAAALTTALRYDAGPGPLGWLLGLLLRPVAARQARKVADGFKRLCEGASGEGPLESARRIPESAPDEL